MGWACTHCGDVNALVVDSCVECGTERGKGQPLRFERQPIGSGVLWTATLLGGAFAGYAIAIWNGRVLKKHSPLTTAIYAVVGLGGWITTVWLLAILEPAHGVAGSGGYWEPGFGVPFALALGFLLVAIPYNLDTLAVNQWMWNHPGRKLVLTFGSGGVRLGYTSFSGATGDLFGAEPKTKPWVAVPLQPLLVIVICLAIGVLTYTLGNVFAPK